MNDWLKSQFTWLVVIGSFDVGRDVGCLVGFGVVTRVAISKDFPWLFVDVELFEDLISLVFRFCCCGTFVALMIGNGLGFNIFGDICGIIWGSFLTRSAVEGDRVTRVA